MRYRAARHAAVADFAALAAWAAAYGLAAGVAAGAVALLLSL